jgi:DNA-directed RNA polymerase subunit beta
MSSKTIRDFSKRGDALPVPVLTRVQEDAYKRFLQMEKSHDERSDQVGLEGLMREVFPIESYDGSMKLEYLYYKLDEPRYTADECRELRLTYGRPFRVGVRLVREGTSEIAEEEIYLGEIPIMMGGGEFIVNGAERVIVSQLHRSPGVDFSVASRIGDRPLHSSRIIPERGSWIELEVTKKDVLAMRIDQSTKLAATTFLRALDEKYSTTEQILDAFYEVEDLAAKKLTPNHYSAELIIDSETGEELCRVGAPSGDMVATIQASNLGTIRVITNASDPLILNTLAEEKLDFLAGVTEHEAALLKIYGRLRPGNPPQIDKAKALFSEKFFDENRYRLGRVGRFRINRKFEHDSVYCVGGKLGNVPEEKVQHIRAEDFLAVIRYMLDLRAKRNKAHVDDIDHLGNRRLRTLDELATEEMRKGFLKLRRTVQERMSTREPGDLAKIADLVNSKSISSAIEFFFGRSELSQVVDQTNPLSMLVHERRLSALGPGGLNRKRAGFEVRDVHISHYGRICPIETPEGTNIGLIASLGIYSKVDDYGWGWFWGSIIVVIFVHDAYFYWTHRLIHHPRLFRFFHGVHHESHNPSPWAAYCFSPGEAVIQAGIFPLVALTMPIHPGAFGIFMLWQITFNIAGHTGYEFHAKWLMDSWLGKFLNTPTNHIQHHDSFKGNFGLYFNFWDRWMDTNHPDYEKRFREVTSR